jgi:multidrug efflux pump subunit AcrA (membrane-fusion protein)
MGKKIFKVLKGVAITGASVGGASALGDANLAYAQNVEESMGISETGVIEVTTEVTKEAVTEAVSEVAPEPVSGAATEDVSEVSTEEAENVSVEEIESEITATEEAKVAAEEELGALEEELADAEEQQQIKTGELEAAQAERAEAEQELADVNQAYEDAGYNHEGLDEQQKDVQDKMDEETAAREALKEQHKNLSIGNYYEKEGRSLAKEMILYKLLLTGEVKAEDADKVFFGENFNKDYDNKHFCVKYVKEIDGQPVYVERYFDYVTCDADGNSLFKGDGVNENDSEIVAGINVVEKTPTYKVWTEDPHKVSTYEKNIAGKIKDQKVFGYTFHAAMRDETDGFYAEEGQHKKGADWYSQKEYQQDVKNREEYPNVVAAITTKITTLNERINNITTSLEHISDQINTIQESIKDVSSKIDGFDSTINNLKDKANVISARIAEALAKEAEAREAEARASAARAQAAASQPTAQVAITLESVGGIDDVVTSPAAGVQTRVDFSEPARNQTPSQSAPAQTNTMERLEDVSAPLAVVDVEAPEEIETTIIAEADIAKKADVEKTVTKWNGTTLPVLGGLAAFFAIFKRRKDEEEEKVK